MLPSKCPSAYHLIKLIVIIRYTDSADEYRFTVNQIHHQTLNDLDLGQWTWAEHDRNRMFLSLSTLFRVRKLY